VVTAGAALAPKRKVHLQLFLLVPLRMVQLAERVQAVPAVLGAAAEEAAVAAAGAVGNGVAVTAGIVIVVVAATAGMITAVTVAAIVDVAQGAAVVAAVADRTAFDGGKEGGVKIIDVAIAVVLEDVAAGTGVATTEGEATAAAAAAAMVADEMNDKTGSMEAVVAGVVEGGMPHLTARRLPSTEIAVQKQPLVTTVVAVPAVHLWQQSGQNAHARSRS